MLKSRGELAATFDHESNLQKKSGNLPVFDFFLTN